MCRVPPDRTPAACRLARPCDQGRPVQPRVGVVPADRVGRARVGRVPAVVSVVVPVALRAGAVPAVVRVVVSVVVPVDRVVVRAGAVPAVVRVVVSVVVPVALPVGRPVAVPAVVRAVVVPAGVVRAVVVPAEVVSADDLVAGRLAVVNRNGRSARNSTTWRHRPLVGPMFRWETGRSSGCRGGLL